MIQKIILYIKFIQKFNYINLFNFIIQSKNKVFHFQKNLYFLQFKISKFFNVLYKEILIKDLNMYLIINSNKQKEVLNGKKSGKK